MVIPSTPGLPLFARTRFHAFLRFSRSHTSSINRLFATGRSGSLFAKGGSVPCWRGCGGSPRSSVMKASSDCWYWIFCRFPSMRAESYLPLPTLRAFGVVRPPGRTSTRLVSAPIMPSADFCAAIGSPLGFPSLELETTTQTSRGKSDRFHRTPAESTNPSP